MNADRNKYKDLLVIVVGFSLIGSLFYIRAERTWGLYMLFIALGLGGLGIFSEAVTTHVTKGWEKFGQFLGKISSTVILTVLFAVILSPIALLKKITTKGIDDSGPSNWNPADETTIDFEKMW